MFRVLACFLIVSAVLLAPLQPSATPATQASTLQASAAQIPTLMFRDLFKQGRLPNARAETLAGKRVRLMGFFAPQVIEDLPFSVMTGAPTQRCPYCSEGEAVEHLPYLLVYPVDAVKTYGARERLIVEGELEVGLEYDEQLGQPNQMRIRGARVLNVKPLKEFTRPRAKLPTRHRAPKRVDFSDIDG